MAYSEALRSTILVGGYPAPSPSHETAWAWNGRTWRSLMQRSGPVPQARSLPALAYDSTRERVVLYGGMSPLHQSRYGDVWELSDRGWEDRSVPDGPGPRDHHTGAFDEARAQVVIYGGQDAERKWIRDTWLWNGRAWQRAEGDTPGERVHHAMAYDRTRQRVVLFGGFGATGGSRGDTWEWDGSKWAQAATTGPSPRSHVRMAYDGARGVTVLFGGMSRNAATGQVGAMDDTWLWDGARWVEASPPNRPAPRAIHAMSYDGARRRVVLFSGGASLEATKPDVWEWDGTDWTGIRGIS